MSRSGYSDDLDPRDLAMWRGQVASAMRGKRGQAFLRELIEALDMMPEKRLVASALRREDGEVCAIGSVGARRGINLETLDPRDHEGLASVFGIARQLVREIEFINDDGYFGEGASPEQRWKRMRAWAIANLK
jgi:hypothetical protein